MTALRSRVRNRRSCRVTARSHAVWWRSSTVDAISEVMSSPQLAADPVEAWATTATAQLDAFTLSGILGKVVEPTLPRPSTQKFPPRRSQHGPSCRPTLVCRRRIDREQIRRRMFAVAWASRFAMLRPRLRRAAPDAGPAGSVRPWPCHRWGWRGLVRAR